MNYPHQPKRQVNQITTSTNSTKPESTSLGVSDSPNSPSLSNKFEILCEAGAGSSHSTRVKFIDLCLCIFRGGVRDVGARCANPVVSGHSTVR